MRVAAFLVCAITATLGDEIKLNTNGCPIHYTIDKLIPHTNCSKYYQCVHGTLVERKCPDGLLFNKNKNICDWPQYVECKPHLNEEKPEQDDSNIGGGDNDNNNDNKGSCNCVPGEAPSICAKSGSDGVLVAHEHCNKFFKCSHGKNISMRCLGTLLYNPYKEWCDFPENVMCGDRIIPDPDEDEQDNEQEDNNSGGGDNDNDNNRPCNCVPGEAPSICAKSGSDGVLVAHEHCNKFFKCSHGKNISMRCPGTLLYNPYKEWCDFPENVMCGDRVIPDPDEDEQDNEQEDNNNGGDDNDNDNNNDNNRPCNCVPGEAPSICAKSGSDGVLVAHEHCNKFFKCSHGKNISMRCPGTLLYNPYKEWCDFPENVMCGDRVIPDPDEDEQDNEQEDNNSGGGDNDNDNNNDNNRPCNCVPGEAPSICAKSGSDGVLVAHEHCNKFFKCSHGKNISMRCPGTLLYNPYKEWCDFPENVMCGDRVIPDPDEDEQDNEQEDNNNGGDDNDNDNNNDNNRPCNCVPGEAPSICAKSGSDGVLVAHEHCNKFFKCSHGKNISMRCPGTLLYNPYKEWCDFPENVMCGDRVIPDPEEDEQDNEQEDNNNGGDDNDNDNNRPCNCVPGEAPSICAKSGSEGVLVAHEHCNKFFKCSHGKNISMRCPGTLLYNPYKEWCDFPENVMCGDRVIPDLDEDEQDNEQEDNNNGGDDNDNDNNNDNNRPCNCVPGEAPSICAKSGSDGVLVAHEHCNKFFKCSHGKNISMRCPGTLLYNTYKEWCDFPENVMCGDRVIPDPDEDEQDNEQEDNNNGGDDNDNDNNNDNNRPCNCVPGEAPSICAKSGSDGVLVAHEHCNKFFKCSHGKNISMRCPGTLLYNPYKEWCDFPENVMCGDRVIPDPDEDEQDNEQEDNNSGGGDNDNDNNRPCNCVPGEAPSICAKSGSDGVLVAHEHCNKFFKCSHGKNISMRCPGTLLYNPYKEWCDFPENVMCGDRVIPDPDEDEQDNEQEDNNSGGGDNDNDNNRPCNCVPGEAPSICAKSGSDGVLVAHEHCNKFFKCSYGKNISMRCPGTLLYNPYKEWCDFPENVMCGDRVIPDPEEDEQDNEQEDNNNGGDDNDNDNNRPCNCVPGEAPSICAKSGSDGVLVAHEHCNKFFKCSHGKNISMRCPGTLLYNPYKEWCDFPENIMCGDRVIPDPDEDEQDNEQEDNNNGGDDNDNDNNNDNNRPCNCVPGEAPSICAKSGSDGVLVAHEHCNKFFKCSHGKNISMRCPGTLLYNPYKEWCDFPENVMCGDRVIPDPDEDEQDNEQEDNNNGGDDNDNDNNNDNNRPCNCVPGEAPSICAKSGSDGVLVAHEHCNKFFKCSHGKNISMRCPGTLLYNPYKEWCDFPENVMCGARVIPDPEEDEQDNEQEDNNNGGDDNDNDNNRPCNCVPGEAPSICAKSGSDGVLVAHEHCNKFFKCSYGKNISMRCPGTLLYNPYKEWCDFPENVMCGDRVIPDPEEDEQDNEQEDNNNGGDDNDNDNNRPCNCVPGEAPSICAKSGSDGVLVAHEHCNKFFKCSHGKNISMRCPGTLLYNPYKEWCDFPENVMCGDRVIPDTEEDEQETE